MIAKELLFLNSNMKQRYEYARNRLGNSAHIAFEDYKAQDKKV